MNRSKALLGLFIAALALPGCYVPGGSGFSQDTFTYESTSWRPYTITLKDTRTGQNFWSMEVPVGKQLVLNFRAAEGMEGSATPDIMEWEIMDQGELFGQLANSIPVPPSDSRRIDTVLRDTPELPPAMGGSTAPASNPK